MKFFENNNLGNSVPKKEISPENKPITEDGLTSLGIGSETIEIINKIPGISINRIKERISFMENAGIKRAQRHIEKYPFQSLVCTEESILNHIAELNLLGLDAVYILDKQIQLLFVSIDDIKSRFEILNKIFAEKLLKIINKSPGILGQSSENVLSKIGFLSDLGIKNPTSLINTAPETLTLSTESIENQIKNIQKIFPAIDLDDFIKKFPKVFTYSEEKLIQRKKNIDRIINIYNVDFSVEDLVSISPQVLTYGYSRMIIVARLLKRFKKDEPRKIIKLITKAMDDILIAACEDYPMEEDSFDDFMYKVYLSGRSDLSMDDKKKYITDHLSDEKIIKQIPKLGRKPN